ncbi:MAG: hypothetical protein NC343_06515 [Muribaculum sp.]|nr:hypothetical protein [Muribaculaceae bacterium]MCM1081387.1 hypothetical protein [Muribaculum sp.]
MKLISLSVILSTVIAALPSCKAARQPDISQDVTAETLIVDKPLIVTGWNSSKALPKAIIYKTNGDFSNNVPITLSNDGKTVISYPAPSDIACCKPIKLKNGFLLDRRGITSTTVFTHYTYDEYAKLAKSPGAEQMKKAIIPGSHITEIVELPFKNGQVTPAQCDSLISNKLEGCNVIYKIDAVMIGPENI